MRVGASATSATMGSRSHAGSAARTVSAAFVVASPGPGAAMRSTGRPAGAELTGRYATPSASRRV